MKNKSLTPIALIGSRVIAYFFLLLFLVYTSGCNYYKVEKTYSHGDMNAMPPELSDSGKYVILHNGTALYAMKDIVIEDDKNTITFTADTLLRTHLQGLAPDTNSANRYIKKYSHPINEVHIHITPQNIQLGARATLDLQSVRFIDIYDAATGTTIASYIFGGIGIAAGALVVAFAVILATKSSCPFVYITNGEKKIFSGEIYGGAIYSSLERNDYLKLEQACSEDPILGVQITNELLERQYTNIAEILTVEHDSTEQVTINQRGEVVISRHSVQAITNDKNDQNILAAKDNQYFTFEQSSASNAALSEIELAFPLKAQTATVSLNLFARNSFWLDYTFGKFTEKFGTYYSIYAEDQKTVSAKKNIAWSLSQNIPLSVYIKKNGQWEFADFYHVTGPMASRDMTLTLDLQGFSGDTLEVKLRCGRLFWEIDYAGLLLHDESSSAMQRLNLQSGTDEQGNNIEKSLVLDDNLYLEQPTIGNSATLSFENIVPAKGKRISYFLHTKGYYEYIRDFKNKPNKRELLAFRKKGSFNQLSEELYRDFIQHPFQIALH